eukprot:22376-Pelagococcus_subviridis.AAC.6
MSAPAGRGGGRAPSMAEQLAAMRGGNAAYGAAATATAPSPSRAGFTTSANPMYDVEDGDRGGAEGDRSPLLPRGGSGGDGASGSPQT